MGLTIKPVGKLDAENPHVQFDERGWETDRSRGNAPVLDSTPIRQWPRPTDDSLEVRFGVRETVMRGRNVIR